MAKAGGVVERGPPVAVAGVYVVTGQGEEVVEDRRVVAARG